MFYCDKKNYVIGRLQIMIMLSVGTTKSFMVLMCMFTTPATYAGYFKKFVERLSNAHFTVFNVK